jgi:hypothetical protein
MSSGDLADSSFSIFLFTPLCVGEGQGVRSKMFKYKNKKSWAKAHGTHSNK